MTWYEDSAPFTWEASLPFEIGALAGPHGAALVDVYSEGRTTKGWGLESRDGGPGFMANYVKGRFWAKPRELAFVRNDKPYAIVMRSVNLIALDIDRHMDDGGADGFIAAAKLELPETLAQTSKSGEGRHLFYRTDEPWSDETGFGRWDDAIGIEPGIDVRTTGCVYRYPSQRWNHLEIADVPDWLRDRLEARRTKKLSTLRQLAAAAAADPDDEEALIMHDALLQELNKPIAAGKRNNSLFAIGSQMKQAAYPNWEDEVNRRATEVGLDAGETAKLISNIEKYA